LALDQPAPRAPDRAQLYRLMDRMMQGKFGLDGYDPLARAVELAETAYRSEQMTAAELVAVHLKVAPYYHATLKAVELRAEVDVRGSEERKRAVEELCEILS
jgi:hypothetical protein